MVQLPSESGSVNKVLRPEQARQGIMLGHIRYVLAISLTLAAIAGAVLLLGKF